MDDFSPDDERDLVAAEYALGLLDSGEWVVAQARYAQDSGFAATVHRWQARFSHLYDQVDEAEVPPALWARVSAGTRVQVARLARRVAAWRAGAVTATAMAAALAAVLVLQPARTAPPARPQPAVMPTAIVAQLVDTTGKPHVVARYDQANSRLNLRTIGLAPGKGVPELWVIADGGAPRSLGLIAATGSATLAIDPAARASLHNGATLAITLEDAATAPHAAPSGDIVASGMIASL